MKFTLTGKNLEVTKALEDHVRSGLDRVTAVRGPLDKIVTVLRVQKDQHIVEMDVHARKHHLYSKSFGNDMYTSIDAALARLDRQLEKLEPRHN